LDCSACALCVRLAFSCCISIIGYLWRSVA
jgi:hypothetical protein